MSLDRYAERAQGMIASEVRALFAVASRPEIVSLAGGMPAVDALPMEAVAATVAPLDADRVDGVQACGWWEAMPAMDGLWVVPVARTAQAGAVLRVVDSRSGRVAEVEPGLRRPLRVWVHLPLAGDPGRLSGLRTLLVADVLSRTVELYGGQALVSIVRPTADDGAGGNLAAAIEVSAADVGIHPPVARGGQDALHLALGGPADVHVAGPSGGPEGPASGIRLDVSAVQPRQAPPVVDPLTVRLALLTRVHHEPAVLSPDVLAEAERTLARWRRAVAGWAQAPSKPTCAEIVGDALAGLKDNLTVPGLLDALHRLEREPGLPDGSRFETAAYLDRVLGLDLTREVGRPQPPRPAP